jgi:hypothetical protein
MSGNEVGTKKVIDRRMLIAAAKVLDQFNNDESDSVTMGQMRKVAFEDLPREDMLTAIDYLSSPSDYIVNEDAGT